MRKVLILFVLALVGYVVFEYVRRYLHEQEAIGEPAARPIGPVHGAAMTAGGRGQVARTLGPDGSSSSERVGRGVVRRGG